MGRERKLDTALTKIHRILVNREPIDDETIGQIEHAIMVCSIALVESYAQSCVVRDTWISVMRQCVSCASAASIDTIMIGRIDTAARVIQGILSTRKNLLTSFLPNTITADIVNNDDERSAVVRQHLRVLKILGFEDHEIDELDSYKIAIIGIYGASVLQMLKMQNNDSGKACLMQYDVRKILGIYKYHDLLTKCGFDQKEILNFDEYKLCVVGAFIEDINTRRICVPSIQRVISIIQSKTAPEILRLQNAMTFLECKKVDYIADSYDAVINIARYVESHPQEFGAVLAGEYEPG